MSRALTALLRRIPHPQRLAVLSWPAVEQDLGFTLPVDYKILIERYDALRLWHYIDIFDPFSDDPARHLRTQIECSARVRPAPPPGHVGNNLPFPFHPREGDLVPWGRTIGGIDGYWLTNGTSEQWTVTLVDHRGKDHRAYDLTLSEFLLALYDGFRCPLLPANLLQRTSRPPGASLAS